MAFDFDLEAAINSIAALERTVPGITTAYGYGQNPVEIQGDSVLPACVHIPMGPRTATEAYVPGLHTAGATFQLDYRVACKCLIVESIGDRYPADEAGANKLWKPLADTFFNLAAMNTLSSAAGASVHTAHTDFDEPSYDIVAWPPAPMQLRYYWALSYTVTYTFIG